MTVDLVRAHCPRCGATPAIFIRSDDGSDLVCDTQACREGAPPQDPIADLPPSRRIFWRRR